MQTESNPAPLQAGPSAELFRGPMMAGLCLATATLPTIAWSQTNDGSTSARPGTTTVGDVLVTGRKNTNPEGLSKLEDTIEHAPQTIDVITRTSMRQQSVTNLQEALRYAPGITLNSGEGGAHGDNINLRGLRAIDGFFQDGIRDPGSYARDSFNLQSVEVLQGAAAVLFGNGPSGGVVNQTSKQPSLTALREASFETGTNDELRGALDVDQPLSDSAAFRVNLMGETTHVADRNDVRLRRWGAAPTLALGLGQPTSLTLSYFHQQEDNVPDYGIPFLFGEPAPVSRNLYYGLKDQDITQTNVNIVSAVLRHDFGENLTLTDTFRYANYWSNYRVSAPIFGNDFTGGPPVPGTPLGDILIYRDRPSSEGTQSYLTDHLDLTARADVGPFKNTIITGAEIGRQTTDYVRFDNGAEGVDGVDPTPLLEPNAGEAAPNQHTVDARPNTTSDIVGVYLTDQIALTRHLNFDVGVRYDRYDTRFNDAFTDDDGLPAVSGFHHVDQAWSPRGAVVFKPTDNQTFYLSYATSFDPAASYLTLAPDSASPPPQTARSYELGAKTRWLGGLLQSTIAVFRVDASNVTVSDPDDPTLQEAPGVNERVQGVELTTSGHLTKQLEINVNYTFMDPKITGPASAGETGNKAPGAAANTASLWLVYEPTEDWQVGMGANYVDQRYADAMNTASVPGYTVLNGLLSYQITDAIRLQLNVQNIADIRYFTGAYYSDANENHVLPGQGRVFTISTGVNF